MLSLYHGLNRQPSDPEADDITMCHHASLLITCFYTTVRFNSTIVLLDEMPVFNIMVTLGTPDRGTCTQVSQIIGLFQALSHTCMSWDYREWESVFKVHSMGHPLIRGGT